MDHRILIRPFFIQLDIEAAARTAAASQEIALKSLHARLYATLAALAAAILTNGTVLAGFEYAASRHTTEDSSRQVKSIKNIDLKNIRATDSSSCKVRGRPLLDGVPSECRDEHHCMNTCPAT